MQQMSPNHNTSGVARKIVSKLAHMYIVTQFTQYMSACIYTLHAYVSTGISHSKKVCSMMSIHTEKSFVSLVKSNRNHIISIIFKSICNKAEVCLVENQSENVNAIGFLFNLTKIIQK